MQNSVIQQFVDSASFDSLHILADFDNTLTRAFVDGKKVPSLIAELRTGGYLSDDYEREANALYDHYHPFEEDLSLPEEERAGKLSQWWDAHFETMIRHGVTRDILTSAASNTHHTFRGGARALFTLLDAHDIPLVLMSAGMGDMIDALMRSQNMLTEDVHIVSNFLEFSESGEATGVKPPVIHTLNKSEVVLRDYPLHDRIANRRNVLVLGDRISDLRMIDGFDYDTMLSIGFYNSPDTTHLQAYKDAFDIVIEDDGALETVIDIIADIS
jgi:5'-nucleotidase